MADPWSAFGSAAIGGGFDLLGSIIGSNASANARNEANRISQNQFHEQMQWQKELAMSGIQMKVNDAKAAGIHPLYALGAPPANFSPIAVGGGASDDSGSIWSRGLSSMGQNISRAMLQSRSKDEREEAFLETARQQQLERGRLENDYLASRNAMLTQQLSAPFPVRTSPGAVTPSVESVPTLGSANGQASGLGVYEPKPTETDTSLPSNRSQSAGPPVSERQFAWTGTGYAPLRPKVQGGSGDLEDPTHIAWVIRNQLLPWLNMGDSYAPAKEWLPQGATGWRFHKGTGEWRPVYQFDWKGHGAPRSDRFLTWQGARANRRNYGGPR